MKVNLKDYYIEDKIAQNLAYELPYLALLSSAGHTPGAVIKQLRHKFKFKDLKSRHVTNIRLPGQ